MLSAHTNWLARRWLAKYYSPPSSRTKTKWLPVSNKVTLEQVKLPFGPLVIQRVWCILLNNYSPQCRWKWWIFTFPLRGSVNIHHYSPPLRWIIVKYILYCLVLSKEDNTALSQFSVFLIVISTWYQALSAFPKLLPYWIFLLFEAKWCNTQHAYASYPETYSSVPGCSKGG